MGARKPSSAERKDAARVRAAERAAKKLIGRTIVRVELRPFDTNSGAMLTDEDGDPVYNEPATGDMGDIYRSVAKERDTTFDPVLYLDDGNRVRFHVTETEGTEYGIELRIVPANKKLAR
jgi:hypothetical protein